MKISRQTAGDCSYRSTVDRIAAGARERHLLAFLGAGISADPPASLPLAEALSEPLVKVLWDAGQFALKGWTIKPEDKELAEENVKNARLERLLDVLHRTHGRLALEYMDVLWDSEWNENHGALAALIANEVLPCCITLNFDLLIERAASEVGCSTSVICPLTKSEHAFGHGPLRSSIIKPHGTFAPDSWAIDQYEYFSATLSQVGSSPDKRNVSAIGQAIKQSPTLIVAGYSDNDWDIFPILTDMSSALERVVWVEYVEPVKSKLSDDDLLSQMEPRVVEWLQALHGKSEIVFGASKHVFADVVRELDLWQMRPRASRFVDRQPDASAFQGSAHASDVIRAKTLVSLCMLVEGTGSFSEHLLGSLLQNSVILKSPGLRHKVENLMAHQYHTTGQIPSAIPHMKQAIKWQECARSTSGESTADYTIWLGYEYLCMAKRPVEMKILWPLLV